MSTKLRMLGSTACAAAPCRGVSVPSLAHPCEWLGRVAVYPFPPVSLGGQEGPGETSTRARLSGSLALSFRILRGQRWGVGEAPQPFPSSRGKVSFCAIPPNGLVTESRAPRCTWAWKAYRGQSDGANHQYVSCVELQLDTVLIPCLWAGNQGGVREEVQDFGKIWQR